ncbi:hypothetical protein ACXR2T_08200 [Leucobacter sp. HY1910]
MLDLTAVPVATLIESALRYGRVTEPDRPPLPWAELDEHTQAKYLGDVQELCAFAARQPAGPIDQAAAVHHLFDVCAPVGADVYPPGTPTDLRHLSLRERFALLRDTDQEWWRARVSAALGPIEELRSC